MQIILVEDVPTLGKSGDVVKVRDGYARNYLLPRQLAVLATTKNLARVEHDKKVIADKVAKLRKDAGAIADKIAGISITLEKQVGAEDKIFGSVTAKEIADAVAAAGVSIDRKRIVLADPIRALGAYDVPVKLGADVSATLKVWVVAKRGHSPP
jgi:large subunit ribosomal protein L9